MARIPVVDVGPLLGSAHWDGGRPDGKVAGAAAQILRAATSHGVFQIVNHGLTAEERRETLEASSSFFAQGAAAKQVVAARPADAAAGFTRGYIGFGHESGSDRQEVKEAFSLGYDWPAGAAPRNLLEGPNIYPESGAAFDGERFRTVLNRFYSHCLRISADIAAGLALALGQPALSEAMQVGGGGETISLLRLFHYLPYSNSRRGRTLEGEAGEAAPQMIGSSPHTDWGFFTLVLQEERPASDGGGLEVWCDGAAATGQGGVEGGGWVHVASDAPPGALTVNVGDYLSLLTGGRLLSPRHRVSMPAAGPSRLSLVFFAYPPYNTRLAMPAATEASYQHRLLATSLLQQQQLSQERQGLLQPRRLEDSEATALVTAAQVRVQRTPFGEFIAEKWGQVARL
jgi:isopenicillin N synthase-like dioxygenase